MPVAHSDGAFTFHPNIAVTDVPLNENPQQFQEPNPGQESCLAASNQGLTLVIFSAQRKRFRGDRGCI
jgi:hypothetical protein